MSATKNNDKKKKCLNSVFVIENKSLSELFFSMYKIKGNVIIRNKNLDVNTAIGVNVPISIFVNIAGNPKSTEAIKTINLGDFNFGIDLGV